MAKKESATPSKPGSPNHLKLDLFAPGMSILHRAGLGGLACSLRAIERAHERHALRDGDVPGGPWSGSPPWTVDPLSVTLSFGKAQDAREYLRRLFAVAFNLCDDLVFLPGQYGESPPSLAVRANLQQGLTLSFLQHGRVRKLAKPILYRYQPEGEGGRTLELEYRPCSYFKHQDAWKDITDSKGHLKAKPVEVVGPMNPGAMVRHNAFPSHTKIEESAGHALALYFALVGCLALPINRGSGVLIIPDVDDLEQFCDIRPYLTPSSTRECRVTGASDAALQAQVRLHGKRVMDWGNIPACHAITFEPTTWATQQKSRVRAVQIPPGDELRLSQFEAAMNELSPRVASRKIRETTGRGKQKQTTERTEWFWTDSIVRPLVADNLAQGRRWYRGFIDLMTKMDPSGRRPLRDRLPFEKRGLNAMLEQIPWQDRGESTVVRAVHEALRRRYAQIADENKGQSVAMKKRWAGEYDRWRLAFAGAKTPEQFRRSLCDMFSRARVNEVLKEEWGAILPMLDDRNWQMTRDLALLGLASYSGKGAKEIEVPTDAPPEAE